MKKQSGFSLVELMIAVVIGLIITAGVIELFLNNRQMYRIQDNYARLQENGRYALDILSSAVVSTGFIGCASRSDNELQNMLTNFTEHQRNYDTLLNGYASEQNSWAPTLPTIIQNDNPVNNSDILLTRNTQPSDTRINTSSGNNIEVSSTIGLASGDTILVYDCEMSAIFEIAEINGNTLTIANIASDFDYDFKAGGRVQQIDTNVFFIRQSQNSQPTLNRRNSQGRVELIQGLEAIRLFFNTDNGDGYIRANDSFGINDWNSVTSVRISLLLASTETNLTIDGNTFSDDDGDFSDYVATDDGRLRRIVSKTITLRNKTP